MSLPKTKLMVTGFGIGGSDRAPIAVGDSEVECVEQFPYLGSLVTSGGIINAEVNCCLANASKAFGAMRQAVFKDCHLTVTTKRRVYEPCVLSILLYGSECWTPLCRHLNRLEAFHHRCIHTVLRITNRQQWEQHISSAMTRDLWGDPETVTTKITKRRLEWLGHVARMPNHCMLKIALFGWLPQTRPTGGPRKRWEDQIWKDLKSQGVLEAKWYDKANHSRDEWRGIYREGLQASLNHHQQQQGEEVLTQSQDRVWCHLYQRSFRRESNRKRLKCLVERAKSVWEQWFRSKGGLTVHSHCS